MSVSGLKIVCLETIIIYYVWLIVLNQSELAIANCWFTTNILHHKLRFWSARTEGKVVLIKTSLELKNVISWRASGCFRILIARPDIIVLKAHLQLVAQFRFIELRCSSPAQLHDDTNSCKSRIWISQPACLKPFFQVRQ